MRMCDDQDETAIIQTASHILKRNDNPYIHLYITSHLLALNIKEYSCMKCFWHTVHRHPHIINSSNHCNTLQKMYISTIFLFAKDQYSSKNVHIWTLFLFVKESLLPLIVGHNHFLYIPGLQIEAIHYFSCIYSIRKIYRVYYYFQVSLLYPFTRTIVSTTHVE